MGSADRETEVAATVSPESDEAQGGVRADAESASSLKDAQAEIEELLKNPDPVPPEPPAPGELATLAVPDKLQRAIDIRISLWQRLLHIERERHALARHEVSPPARAEYSRQVAEIRRIPSAEEIAAAVNRLEAEDARLSDPMARLARGAAADRLVNDTSACGEYRHAITMGLQQARILTTRAKLDSVVASSSTELVESEPLSQLCKRFYCDADALLAWTFYARGLEQRIAECDRQIEAHRQRVDSHRDRVEGGGLFRKIRRLMAENEEAPRLDPEIPERQRAAKRELEAIEPRLAELFWALYEDIAWLYASGSLTREHNITARACLRYGLVGHHPTLIACDKLTYVLDDCRDNVYDWDNTLDTTHVVYADEHLAAVACCLTTPGPDEDADIAGPTSKAYKADRVWRQLVGGKIKIELLRQRLSSLSHEARTLGSKVNTLTERRNKLVKSPSRKLDAEAAKTHLTELRPRLARKQRMLNMLETKHLPRQVEIVQEAGRRMNASDEIISPEHIVRREARFIRRLVRLASHLKTPYPHFVLRDRLVPGNPNCHDRKTVHNVLQSIEHADRYIFHQTLIAARQVDRQLTMRVSPTMLIVPACGATGISIIPRRESESGKVMVPLLGQRREGLNEIAMRALADFRWDCSVEDAGADWLSTDSLCADYANVRWSYRHRNQEVQRRAGIHRKQRDRQNWRSHYLLYLESADDGGRKLFFKCLDIYEVLMRYIRLPDGVTRHYRT